MTAVSDRAEADRAASDRAASDRAASERVAAEARAGERTDDAKPTKLEQLRARYPWLDHLVRAGTRYTDHHGDHYAAAVTFFSILSLVPLLMIAFAVAGYVLFFNPNLLNEIRDAINAALPPNLAEHDQPDHRPGHRPAEHRGRLRPAHCPVLGHRLDDEPARGADGAVGAVAGTACAAEAAPVRPHRAVRPRDRARRVLRDHRCGVRVRRGPALPRRSGRPGLGSVPAPHARCPARPHRELPRLPLGDRPAAPPAHADPQRGEGRRARGGRLRGPQAGHDHLPEQHHQHAERCGVRISPGSADIRQLRLALHPVRDRVGGDGEGRREGGARRRSRRPR